MKLWLALLALLLPAACAAGGAPVYRIRDLGGLPEHAWSEARAINKSGAIAGYSMPQRTTRYGYVLEKSRAVVWSASGEIRDLGTLGGDASSAYDINDLGQVAGCARDAGGLEHAVIWEADGTIRDLAITRSCAKAINNHGQVVGDHGCSAFLWTEKGGIVDLPCPEGSSSCRALAINDAGQAVGWYSKGSGSFRAVMWTIPPTGKSEITITDLSTLTGSDLGMARGISEVCQVTGASRRKGQTGFASGAETSDSYAFVWNPTAGLTKLAKLENSETERSHVTFLSFRDRAEAYGIDAAGSVVGSFGSQACLWDRGGSAAYLPDLSDKHLSCARAISDSGQIVGYATVGDGNIHAVMWTPQK